MQFRRLWRGATAGVFNWEAVQLHASRNDHEEPICKTFRISTTMLLSSAVHRRQICVERVHHPALERKPCVKMEVLRSPRPWDALAAQTMTMLEPHPHVCIATGRSQATHTYKAVAPRALMFADGPSEGGRCSGDLFVRTRMRKDAGDVEVGG